MLFECTRKQFFKKTIFLTTGIFLKEHTAMSIDSDMDHASDMNSTVYRAVNGSPGTNLAKVIDLMGGMSHFIGADDIVVIKPNFQWWNHGAPN